MSQHYINRLFQLSYQGEGFLGQTFTRALQSYKAEMVQPGDLNSPSQFFYKVPPTICRRIQVNNKSYDLLSAAAGLAVMDDLSAVGVMVTDQKVRPGVSVMLSATLFHPIHANQDVICSFQTDKTGKFMAFQTMEMLDPITKQVLIRGKHIKFLPMGKIWDFIVSHKLFARYIHYYDQFKDKSYIKKLLANFLGHGKPPRDDLVYPDETSVGAVYSALQVQKINSTHSDGSIDHLVKLRKGMNMMLGQMHGGAAAMSSELGVLGTLESKVSESYRNQMFLTSIQLTYLSALRGNLLIHTDFPNHTDKIVSTTDITNTTDNNTKDGQAMKEPLDRIMMDGGIYVAKDSDRTSHQKPCVQFHCELTPIHHLIK